MNTTQATTPIQKLAKKSLLFTATAALSLATVAASTAPAHALCIKLPGIQLGCEGGSNPVQPPEPEVEARYSVTQRDPHTRSVVREFGPTTQARANQVKRQFERTHYVVYRYAGIGEQVHTKRFASRALAQNYLDTKGPCRDANVFGICVLDLQQVQPAIVEMARVN